MKLRLIEIGADGAPARCPGYTPPLALDALEGTAVLYQAVGFHPPWVGYLVDWDGDVVAAAAFKAPPHEGRVEIAWQVFPEYEGRGIATQTARQLVALAQGQDPAVTVVAHTLPAAGAATRVLDKLGFAFEGESESLAEGRVWQWALSAPAGSA